SGGCWGGGPPLGPGGGPPLGPAGGPPGSGPPVAPGGRPPVGAGCAWGVDSTATELIWPVVRACNVCTSLRYGSTLESKSALSWPTVPSCNWCMLASTPSLFMLISTLVQSAAA